MISLKHLINHNEKKTVLINNEAVEVRGMTTRDLCELSEKHIETITKLLKSFYYKNIVEHADLFDDILILCICEEGLTLEVIKELTKFQKIELLKAIASLSIPEIDFIKSYKISIGSDKQPTDAKGVAKMKYRKEAKRNKAKALGFNESIENIIFMCEFLQSKNIQNSYDMSFKTLFSKYHIQSGIEDKASLRLIDIAAAAVLMNHGKGDGMDSLINKLSEY